MCCSPTGKMESYMETVGLYTKMAICLRESTIMEFESKGKSPFLMEHSMSENFWKISFMGKVSFRILSKEKSACAGIEESLPRKEESIINAETPISGKYRT